MKQKVNGLKNAVVQVVNEKTKEIEFTIRINGNVFEPKTLNEGLYTINVGDPDLNVLQTKEGVSSKLNNTTILNFEFNK